MQICWQPQDTEITTQCHHGQQVVLECHRHSAVPLEGRGRGGHLGHYGCVCLRQGSSVYSWTIASDHGQWPLGTQGTLWWGNHGLDREGTGPGSPTLKEGTWEALKPDKRKLNSPMIFFLGRN